MIVIIGAPHHGKNTLAEAIKIMTEKSLEVMTTNDLMLVAKEKSKMEEELKEITIGELVELNVSDNRNHRKKGKEVKPWQRTKFYQR